MEHARGISRVALRVATISSIAVAAFLAAAALGIWMENFTRSPTPRINSFTVGLGLVPVPAVAWMIYLWTRVPASGIYSIILRVVVSCAIAAGAYYCIDLAIFAALFVG